MVQIKAQVARIPRALTEFALLLFLFSISTGCTHGPLSHVPPFRAPLPPAPGSLSCEAMPSSVYPGDLLTVTGTAAGFDPRRPASYNWSAPGLTVSGTSTTVTLQTGGLQPGTYTVSGHVTVGTKPDQMADCKALFTVKSFQPPTVSCSANPATVMPGTLPS